MLDLRKKLQVGDTVSLNTLESGFQTITVLAAGQPGCRVTEVGCDYFVANDETSGVRLRVPVHYVASVIQAVAAEPAQAA